jgi:hypothetical protein
MYSRSIPALDLPSDRQHFHDLVAEVIDDPDGHAPGFGHDREVSLSMLD